MFPGTCGQVALSCRSGTNSAIGRVRREGERARDGDCRFPSCWNGRAAVVRGGAQLASRSCINAHGLVSQEAHKNGEGEEVVELELGLMIFVCAPHRSRSTCWARETRAQGSRRAVAPRRGEVWGAHAQGEQGGIWGWGWMKEKRALTQHTGQRFTQQQQAATAAEAAASGT